VIIAGWRSVSLVDVKGATSFTIWLCGCNLRCPFCHNWRIADRDPKLCRGVDVDTVVEELEASAALVDYLHVTGGEPLLQADALVELFRKARKLGVGASLNSNLTLPGELEKVVDLVDHVATDLKVPWAMYGVPGWEELYGRFLQSLKLVAEKGVVLELRVPVARLPAEWYAKIFEDVASVLRQHGRAHVVFNKVLGRPVVEPRDKKWCEKHCLSDEEFETYVHNLKALVKENKLTTSPP